MITILRKPGFILNPNDKVVNAILKRAEKNDGHCPCDNPDKGTEYDMCPCRNYRENNKCCCNLYIADPSVPIKSEFEELLLRDGELPCDYCEDFEYCAGKYDTEDCTGFIPDLIERIAKGK